jgi:hypothetical protein
MKLLPRINISTVNIKTTMYGTVQLNDSVTQLLSVHVHLRIEFWLHSVLYGWMLKLKCYPRGLGMGFYVKFRPKYTVWGTVGVIPDKDKDILVPWGCQGIPMCNLKGVSLWRFLRVWFFYPPYTQTSTIHINKSPLRVLHGLKPTLDPALHSREPCGFLSFNQYVMRPRALGSE